MFAVAGVNRLVMRNERWLYVYKYALVNALWRRRTGPALFQVGLMACYLMTLSHDLNLCWLFIEKDPLAFPVENEHVTRRIKYLKLKSHLTGTIEWPYFSWKSLCPCQKNSAIAKTQYWHIARWCLIWMESMAVLLTFRDIVAVVSRLIRRLTEFMWKIRNVTTYAFRNFNGAAFGSWKWARNFIPQFTGHVSTYPSLG